ncbi:hypothetical protein IHE44_0003273 [Lamprotornis superbus]|uniref:Arrestin-C n=1 Tax=Lamprotornis superbus TaxID=245042 RepID=A0A835NYE6_9PASS|nr:hypothetical protein IHE44_0003273 [Lamprotornis superbus]
MVLNLLHWESPLCFLFSATTLSLSLSHFITFLTGNKELAQLPCAAPKPNLELLSSAKVASPYPEGSAVCWDVQDVGWWPCLEMLLPQHLIQVFKKTSPNSKLSLYLGKRDYVDNVDSVESVDGVCLIDPEYLKDRKDQAPKTLTPLQEKLMKKLGENAYPFTFEIATNLPCSITLQPGPDDVGKACGVDFEVKGFCAENLEEKIHKRNSVRLIIRKVQFAPLQTGPAPRAETTRQFMMSDKPLHLEATLDKEVYYHGEPIHVTVNINNTTNKVVKKIKISVDQITDVVLYSLDKYTKTVCTEEINENVAANSTFSKTYSVTPMLSANRQKRGLALDGKLKHEDTNLASTTILRPGMDKEVLGILVSYKVKVNLVVSRGGILGDLTASDVGVEMPVILMHPKPDDWISPPPVGSYDEDIVIEEFARQKLKGEKDDEDEKEEAEKEES